MMLLFAALIAATLLNIAVSECPNACSSHGRCGAFDMCQCYRNWMANDCSERICQFGLAHVDSPKGDLDASGITDQPTKVSVENSWLYPYGTSESYPDTRDARAIGLKSTNNDDYLKETAHFPMECSNKGLCDRSTGTCGCFPGYTGSACQYASCPTSSTGVCNGHGVCMDAKALALSDNGNLYRLWDQHKTLGCKCDAGYSSSDCSQRVCKYGADPLYYDDKRNVRYPTFTFQFSSADTVDIAIGNYSIIFYDRFGEDWQTGPIDIGASCSTIVKALESLPNNIIPPSSILCAMHLSNALKTSDMPIAKGIPYESVFYPEIAATSTQKSTLKYTKYTLSFTGNPGKIKQPKINMYLDGLRPTLNTLESKSTLGYDMYINGFGPEDVDFVPDLCEGVQVSIDTGELIISSQSLIMLLKRCLGDSDGNFENNRDIFNWDYGADSTDTTKVGNNPHLIKLVDSTQDSSATIFNSPNSNMYDLSLAKYSQTILCKDGALSCNSVDPPGFYVIIYWDSTNKKLRTLTQPNLRFETTSIFNIYTSRSWLNKMAPKTYTFGGVDNSPIRTEGTADATSVDISAAARSDAFSNEIYTVNDLSSENSGGLEKGDYIMVLHNDRLKNPAFPNIYQIQKIEITPPKVNIGRRFKITLDYGVNSNFYSNDEAYIYKVNTFGTYNYVAQCSGRGICNGADGLCQCFKGYTGDECGIQNSLVY